LPDDDILHKSSQIGKTGFTGRLLGNGVLQRLKAAETCAHTAEMYPATCQFKPTIPGVKFAFAQYERQAFRKSFLDLNVWLLLGFGFHNRF